MGQPRVVADEEGTSPRTTFELEHLRGRYSVCRLDPDAMLPGLISSGRDCLLSVTRTPDELSIVCPEELAPPGATVSTDWAALRVRGVLDHDQVGVLVTLAQPLANYGIPILVISSFDTDYLLVAGSRFDDAVAALAERGHAVR